MNELETFVERVEACQPALVGVASAATVLDAVAPTTVTHAGPPLTEPPNGPLLGAIIGGLIHEGWDEHEAIDAVSSDELDLRSNQDCGLAAPLAGVVTPTMPVWVVEDTVTGTRAYAPLNEGLGRVLRFGAYGHDVQDRLSWMREVAGPAIAAALGLHGPLELRPIMTRSVRQGDELHNRNAAATAALVRELAPELASTTSGSEVLAHMRTNDHAFLNISVAASKCLLDGAFGAAPDGIIVAMGSNGVSFGMKVQGLGDQWILAPAPTIHGRTAEGYLTSDASPALGDSCLTEAAGFGGSLLVAAPDITEYLGCNQDELLRRSQAARSAAVAGHRTIVVPGFGPAPLGLHVGLALEAAVRPVIDSGIAHREPGVGQIGAGLFELPEQCLMGAIDLLAELASASTSRRKK